MAQSCSGGSSEAFPAFPVDKPGSSRKDPTKPLQEGLRGGRRCVSSASLMPWRPKKDTRRTPFHANWHCLQATKDYLYQFHLVACRERLRGDLPDWLWAFPISRLLLLPRRGGEKSKPKENKQRQKEIDFPCDFRKTDFIVSASSPCFALQVLFYVQTELVSCPLARHRGFGWINVASLMIIPFLFNRSAFGAHYN